MDLLLPLAAKSLLIAGVTLLVLQLLRKRSAADRSWIAHLGLLALAILPLSLLLPQLEVAVPWLAKEPLPVPASALPVVDSGREAVTAPFPGIESAATIIDWGFWAYAAPAGLLLLLTLIALGRLVILKARATVLVEPHWLTALAYAQRRMGFKHGTALLTSDELRSPVSWGLVRPVILLNSEAAEAHGEAEAIIAHELAHVARLDWVKLLLSRVTVAIFWFNPLVWLLAREAHQLREEAADDAVLGSDIEDTEYARLLVGIARHECRGLLLGAHGVAPARNSLARRVQRVLDAALTRAPGGWRWTSAAAFFAAGMAVPLAVLQFVPTVPAAAYAQSVDGKRLAEATPQAPDRDRYAPGDGAQGEEPASALSTVARNGNEDINVRPDGSVVMRGANGALVSIEPPSAAGPGRTLLRGPDGSTLAFAGARGAHAVARSGPRNSTVEHVVGMKALGVDSEYLAAMRKALPRLADDDEIMGMAALGVTPAYVRDLAAAGFPNLDADQVIDAKAIGITPGYARSMAASNIGKLTIDDLVEMRAVGLTPNDVSKLRQSGKNARSPEEWVRFKTGEDGGPDIEEDPDP